MAITDIKTIGQCLKVAELRSISRAADVLNIAQPWLSTRIRAYEAELGFALFDRSRRQLALTAEGEAWVAQARRFIEAAGHYGRGVQAIAVPTELALRLGCPASASGVGERDDLIRAFRARHPQVSVNIDLLSATQLADAQRNGTLDLVLMNDPLPADLDASGAVLLRRQRTVVFMPTAWRRDPAAPIALTDLAQHEVAVLPETLNPSLVRPVYAALRAAGARLVMMNDSNFVALHHHAITHGIAAITVDTLADTLAYVPDYRRYPLAGDVFEAGLWLLRPPGNAPREAALFWKFAAAWREWAGAAD